MRIKVLEMKLTKSNLGQLGIGSFSLSFFDMWAGVSKKG
jgi:hypothetical protein